MNVWPLDVVLEKSIMDDLTTTRLQNRQDRKGQRRQGLLQPGATLQDRYQVLGTLGVGGFSSVYKARDMHFPTVTRLCAVKEMVHVNRDPKIRQMATASFEREASILATLDHPAVPDVYDFFTESDRSYLVIEYINGRDLEALLSEQATTFPVDTVIDWSLQLCNVLEYLHSHEPNPVIFRDLKPSNIMLDHHGRVRLIDFNIAKLFQTGLKGTMIGTEGYSPPEQYRGESSPAGDIYALGATLHHLMTRQDPRTEPPFSFADRPINEVNLDIPAEFEAIISRCLSYDAADRYQKVIELRQALESIAPIIVSLNSRPIGQQNSHISSISPVATKRDGSSPAIISDQSAMDSVSPIWVFKCEDEIRSTPTILDDAIYLGSYDHNLYAINAEEGKLLWKYSTGDCIASSASVYKESVFIGSADGYLYSINRNNGRLQWRFETGGPVYSTPRADFDHVFFGSDDGYIYAISAANGRKVWQSNAHGVVRSSPYLGDNRLYFGNELGYVFSLDLSGNVKWQFQAKRAVTSSPTFAEDMIFVGSRDSTVYAIDASSGWALWRFRTRRPIVSSAAVSEKTVFIGSSDGNLYALDIYSGRQQWSYQTEGQINSSPVVVDDLVYFGSTDGAVYCLSTKRGKLLWRYNTRGVVVGSPAVHQGVLYVGSGDSFLYALPIGTS